jgi:uncharacterized protein YheU (UPF0270 family)
MSDFIEIPASGLSEAALAGLIEEFVSRYGTDYGDIEMSLATKAEQVRLALANGDAKIVFDAAMQQTHIVTAEQLRDGLI